MPAMNQLCDAGKVRHIGVSNFDQEHIETALKYSDRPFFANQFELHPLLPQSGLVSYTRDNDMYAVAHTPLARGEVFNVPELTRIADDRSVSEAEVCLAWLTSQENVVAVPRTTSGAHLCENFNAPAIDLSQDEIEAINSVDRRQRVNDPSHAPW
jgi:2,5-diketo-D-gluconate reductase B